MKQRFKVLYGLLTLVIALFILLESPSFSKTDRAEIYQDKASGINATQDILDGSRTLISQINLNRINPVYPDKDGFYVRQYQQTRWTVWNGWDADRGRAEHSGTTSCPRGLYAEGLVFRRFRRENGDIDTYNFALKCGNGSLTSRSQTVGRVAGNEVGEPYPNAARHTGEYWAQVAECRSDPSQPFAAMVGMQVQRYRRNNGDHDTYQFSLDCVRNGQHFVTPWVGTTRGNPVATYRITNFNNRVESLEYQYYRNGRGDKDGYKFRLKHENLPR